MADHATPVALAAIRLNGLPHLERAGSRQQMTALTRTQVAAILDAVVDANEDQARQVAGRHDEVDAPYRQVWNRLIGSMADPHNVEQAAVLLFVAKDLVRIADRVTNIAEDVVFLGTGQVVELG